MKKLLTLVALIATGAACQQQAVNESAAKEDDGTVIMVNHRLFTEVPFSNVGICGDNMDKDCADKTQHLQKRLMKLNPVPVPDYGQEASVTPAEAIARYKRFVAETTDQPLLIVAKQLYPRILLNQYGLLAGTDYTSVLYFTRHMAEAHSLDFQTQANALAVLRGHIPAADFTALLGTVTAQAEKHRQWEAGAIDLLTKVIKDRKEAGGKITGTMSATFSNAGKQRMIDMMKKSQTGTYLAQLHQLQQAID